MALSKCLCVLNRIVVSEWLSAGYSVPMTPTQTVVPIARGEVRIPDRTSIQVNCELTASAALPPRLRKSIPILLHTSISEATAPLWSSGRWMVATATQIGKHNVANIFNIIFLDVKSVVLNKDKASRSKLWYCGGQEAQCNERRRHPAIFQLTG
jgi:hypothetical protein